MAAAGIAWRRPFGLQGCSPVYSVILHLVEVSVNSTVILRGGTGIARGALLGVSARLLALLLGNWTNGATTYQYFSVYRASLSDPLTYVRFFGHVLGHADYEHYMSNMLLLLLVGPGLEEKYGSRNLLATIAVTAFATGLVQFLLFPHSALLGASGVVFMMIVLSSFTEMKKGGIPLTMLLVVALYLGSEIADGLTRTDNVSHLTHIVGGVCGIFSGFRLAKAKKH